MATKTFCDKCGKQAEKDVDWGRFSLDNLPEDEIKKYKNLNKLWNRFIFCGDCTKKIFPKLLKILNIKQTK